MRHRLDNEGDGESSIDSAAQRDWVKIFLAVLLPLLFHGIWFASSFRETQVDLKYAKEEIAKVSNEAKSHIDNSISILAKIREDILVLQMRQDKVLTYLGQTVK